MRTGIGALPILGAPLAPGSGVAAARAYVVDQEHRRVGIRVGTAGLFGFAGHDLEVAFRDEAIAADAAE